MEVVRGFEYKFPILRWKLEEAAGGEGSKKHLAKQRQDPRP